MERLLFCQLSVVRYQLTHSATPNAPHRVPLIMRVPWIEGASSGKRTKALYVDSTTAVTTTVSRHVAAHLRLTVVRIPVALRVVANPTVWQGRAC
eukprot:COSAG02_NODE_15699_length_1148_cov_0.851287_2_plen_95_part_00